MPKFVLKNIDAVRGVQQFKQLVKISDRENEEDIQKHIANVESGRILKDERYDQLHGILDDYEKTLQRIYKSSFRGIIAVMNLIAENESLPVNKFRDITPKGELIKEYEIKYKDLRVYAIKIPNGKLIILCGYKNQQSRDISKFRTLKNKIIPLINKII
jgi:putative component of toxin-antitoxin plasmid stabilization module